MVDRVLGDAMHTTRSAAEYRGAAFRLWDLAARATQPDSEDGFAHLAVTYKPLRTKGRQLRTPHALAPKDASAQ
jgi:hypothetical protein